MSAQLCEPPTSTWANRGVAGATPSGCDADAPPARAEMVVMPGARAVTTPDALTVATVVSLEEKTGSPLVTTSLPASNMIATSWLVWPTFIAKLPTMPSLICATAGGPGAAVGPHAAPASNHTPARHDMSGPCRCLTVLPASSRFIDVRAMVKDTSHMTSCPHQGKDRVLGCRRPESGLGRRRGWHLPDWLAERRLGAMTASRSPFDIVRVTAVRHVRDHVLWLEFSDGLAGELDLADHLIGAALEPLRARNEFARVRLGAETIEWPNGADWAPESLHALVRARNSLRPSPDDTDSAAVSIHTRDVPEISRFFGIIISMFYSDHAGPHFHARCGGDSIAVEIDGDGIRGSFPPNRLPLLFEWRDLHRAELRANWERLRRGESALSIEPLA